MDELKRQAAARALQRVSDGMKLGLGTGSTAKHFVELLGQRVRAGLNVVSGAYRGEFVKFEGVRSFPKPARGAKVPIVFGGESGPALRRVAEYGTGWCGFNLTPDEAAAKIKRIEDLLAKNGRRRSDVELAVSPYTKKITQDDLKRYRDAGVDELVMVNLRPPREESETIKDLEQIARDWVEPAARL